jgi:hypothetical protein
MNTLPLIFAVLAAATGAGGISGLVRVFFDRRKVNAEAHKIGVDADDVLSGRALQMYDRAMTEAIDAKREVRYLNERLAALEDHVDILERLMRDGGLDPPPFSVPRMRFEPDD